METQRDYLHIKDLLGGAEKQLLADGPRATQAENLFEPGRQPPEDAFFWRFRSDGLALLFDPRYSRDYAVWLAGNESMVMGLQLHLKPLLPLLSNVTGTD